MVRQRRVLPCLNRRVRQAVPRNLAVLIAMASCAWIALPAGAQAAPAASPSTAASHPASSAQPTSAAQPSSTSQHRQPAAVGHPAGGAGPAGIGAALPVARLVAPDHPAADIGVGVATGNPLAAPAASPNGQTFGYTVPGTYTLTIPAGVDEVLVIAEGAQGGNSAAGALGELGGFSSGYVAVSTGETLQIDVGGEGQAGTSGTSGGAGGYNGGGAGGETIFSTGWTGGGGGGASDVIVPAAEAEAGMTPAFPAARRARSAGSGAA
jgi:hypothetical protein